MLTAVAIATHCRTMVSQQVQKEAEEKQKKRHVVLKMHDLLMKELAAIEERLPIYTKVGFTTTGSPSPLSVSRLR